MNRKILELMAVLFGFACHLTGCLAPPKITDEPPISTGVTQKIERALIVVHRGVLDGLKAFDRPAADTLIAQFAPAAPEVRFIASAVLFRSAGGGPVKLIHSSPLAASQDEALGVLTRSARQKYPGYTIEMTAAAPLSIPSVACFKEGKPVDGQALYIVSAVLSEGVGTNGTDGNGFGISNYVALGDKVQPGQPSSSSVATTAPAAGHWEDTTQHDELGNVIASGGRVWIPDPPATANQTAGSTSPAAAAQTPSAASSLTAPAVPNRDIKQHEDGSITLSFTAKVDSSNGAIKKGDIVTEVFDPEGKLSYFSVSHTERGVTTVAENIPGAAEGETATTYSKWVGNTLILQGQWDSAGNLVGDRYTVDGFTYTRSIGADGQTQWLDPNGLNANERIQQSYDLETQRLFNLHPAADESEVVSFRALSAEEVRALETGLAQAATAGRGIDYADAGHHSGDTVVTDGGSSTDHHLLNVADIPVPYLVSHFIGVQNPGAYGAGQLAGFDVLPLNENSKFLVNADGDIVAEIIDAAAAAGASCANLSEALTATRGAEDSPVAKLNRARRMLADGLFQFLAADDEIIRERNLCVDLNYGK